MAHQSPQSNLRACLFKTPHNLTTIVPQVTLYYWTYSAAINTCILSPCHVMCTGAYLYSCMFFACTCACIPRKPRRDGVRCQRKGQEGKKADDDTWALCPGTLHLNDITQTHRQNNTSTVKYKRDRLSDTANRRPDR